MSTHVTAPTDGHPRDRHLVYAGPKRMTRIMGGGCIALVAFFVWILIDSADEPPLGEPSIVAAIITLIIAVGVFGLGLLLTFGRRVVVFNLERREVTCRFEWLGLSRERSLSLDSFSAVGIGLCWQGRGAVKHPYYFVRLVSWNDLWVPGGGSEEAAIRQASEIAAATGLDTVLEPEPARFFPVFG